MWWSIWVLCVKFIDAENTIFQGYKCQGKCRKSLKWDSAMWYLLVCEIVIKIVLIWQDKIHFYWFIRQNKKS